MRVIIEKDYETASRRGAEFVAEIVRNKPDAVLGLATGSTPLGLYVELIRLHQEEGLDFSKVTTFNLDEYYGLLPGHDQSYHYFMQSNLLDHINISPAKINVPSGLASNVEAFCENYERMIADAGGIDVQILGIGVDGHIAFNEPGSSLSSRTRLKTLTEETIEDNARFFSRPEEVPRFAITMGIGTILEARKCIMLASGLRKAAVIAEAVEGPVTAQITASALQLHSDVIVIVDEEAGSSLKRRNYYLHVERMTHDWRQISSSVKSFGD